MPRLPEFLARDLVPSTGGVPRGTVGIPVAQDPQADAAALTQGSRAVGEVGTALQQAGGLLVKAEELAAHRQRAQDTLAEKATLQDFRVADQALFEAQRQGDYSTFPERYLKESDRLIADYGKELSPNARAMFVADAKQFRALQHQKALDERTKRRDQETAFTVQREIQQVTTMYHRAGSDFERAFFREQLTGLVEAFTQTGLVDGIKAAKVLEDTDRGIVLEQAQMANRAAPGLAVRELASMMQGGTSTLPAYANVTPDMLPALYDDAVQALSKQVSLQESLNAGTKRQLQETQSNVASDYRSQIYKPNADVTTLVGLTEQIDKDRRLQRVSEEDHKDLLSTIQHRIDKLKDDAFKDRDVPAVAQEALLRVNSADTPAELAQAKQWVEANRGQLSSNMFGSLLNTIRQRGIQDGPENDDVVKEGRRTMLSGAFAGGMIPTLMEQIEPTIKARTSAALDVYYEEMRRIHATEGRAAMRQKAIETGKRLGDLYFPESATQQTHGMPASTPPALQGVRTVEEGFQVLETLDLPIAAKRRLFLQLEQHLPSAATAGPAPTPQTPFVPDTAGARRRPAPAGGQ